MSSRRKRAPPLKINEEKKKQMCWNMHDDRKNEVIDLDVVDDDHPVDSSSSSAALLTSINDNTIDEDLTYRESNQKTLSFSSVTDEAEDSCQLLTPVSNQLNIVILPYCSDPSWKTLLGEFFLQVFPEQCLSENIRKKAFTLMRVEFNDQLRICVHTKEKVDEKEESLLSTYEDALVESSLNCDILEDLMWLQKKRVIVLYQRPGDAKCLKVVGLCNQYG